MWRAKAAAIKRETDNLFDFDAFEDGESDDGSEPDCGLFDSSGSEDESIVDQNEVFVSDAGIDSERVESMHPVRLPLEEPPTTTASARNPWIERRSAQIADSERGRTTLLVTANAEVAAESYRSTMRIAQRACESFHDLPKYASTTSQAARSSEGAYGLA